MSKTISDFLAFYKELFPQDTSYRGASEEEIATLLPLTDRPLPELYIDYLKVFGKNDGLLKLGDDCSCSVDAVLRHRKSYAGKSTKIQPPNAFRFSNEGVSLGRSFLFQEGISEPCIVVNDLDEVGEVLAENFTIFLFRQAWLKAQVRKLDQLAYVVLHRKGSDLTEDVRRVALERDFEPLWFCDRWSFCAEKDQISLSTKLQKGSISVFFIGPKERIEEESRSFEAKLSQIDGGQIR